MKSLRDPPTPVDSPLLINWDVPDAEDAGNARDATTHIQKHTQSSHPTFSDFQTRKIDQTQKIPEMSGMLGGFSLFPKINHQKQILATPLKIDFQTHDNAGDVSQPLLRTGRELQKTHLFANFNSSSKYHCTWPHPNP